MASNEIISHPDYDHPTVGENELKYYNNKYDVYLQQILSSSSDEKYQQLSGDKKELALQEVEALLLSLSIEKNKHYSLENQTSDEGSRLQTQVTTNLKLQDDRGKAEIHSIRQEVEKPPLSHNASQNDQGGNDEETTLNSLSLDLLESHTSQTCSMNAEHSISQDEGDETELSIDLLAADNDTATHEKRSSFDDSEATPDLDYMNGDEFDAGDCSSVELGRTKRSSRIQSPFLVDKSLSTFDHERTPELNSSTRFNSRNNGKRLPSSSGKKGADLYRMRLSMHQDFDDNDKFDKAYTSLDRRFSTFEGSPLLSQQLDCQDRGRKALSQIIGSHSPITPCLDDVILVDDRRKSRSVEETESFQNPASNRDDSFPRRTVHFDDVLSPPTPTQNDVMEEGGSYVSFNNAVEDESDDEDEVEVTDKRSHHRRRIVDRRDKSCKEQQFQPRNLNITQSRFGYGRETRDIENLSQNENGHMPSNDTIEDTERAIMLDRRKRQVARASSRRIPGLVNDSLALNRSTLCHDENQDSHYLSLDKPRVRLKDGASVRVVPLAIKARRKDQKQNDARKDQQERGPLQKRDCNIHQILSLPDPVSSVFSGRMSERLDTVVEWLASKMQPQEESSLAESEILDSAGVVLSLQERMIQSVVLKLQRLSVAKSYQKSISACRGGCLIVLREKDESMERWECSLREKSSFSVLSHARLGATSRKRLPLSRISGYDVVLTTYDALKGKEKVYTMDPYTNQPMLCGDRSSNVRFSECSGEWLSASNSVDGARRQSKELSMLHGIQWNTVIYLDVLGRGSFLLKSSTARATAACALTSKSRFLFFESTNRSPESLVKKFKEDGKSMKTVATFLHREQDMAAEDVLGGMILDLEDVVVGKSSSTHKSRFDKSRESLQSKDNDENDYDSRSSSSGEHMVDRSSFLNTTTQPYYRTNIQQSLRQKEKIIASQNDSYTTSDDEEIEEPL